jgi:folate-dependent phosphoribosylglycinamide formyltransferase PurN
VVEMRVMARRPPTRGAAMIGTTAGMLVFLILLLFAVQTTVALHARSVVTATAYDAAREVAAHSSASSRAAARRRAEQRFAQRLGTYGAQHVRLEWLDVDDPDVVRVRVVAEHPSLLPAAFGGALGLRTTDRRIEVRVERWR